MKSEGELWTTTEEGVRAITVVPSCGEMALGWRKGAQVRSRSNFLPWAAQAWTLVCSHYVMELLENNPGSPQPFIQATAHPARDTLEVLTHRESLVWFFPPGGKFKVMSPSSPDSELRALGGKREIKVDRRSPGPPGKDSAQHRAVCRPRARVRRSQEVQSFVEMRRKRVSTAEEKRTSSLVVVKTGVRPVLGLTGGRVQHRCHLSHLQMLSSSSILLTPSQILFRWVR